MEVKIEIPNLDDDALAVEETMKRWMSDHPCSAVLIVLATNKKVGGGCRPQFQVCIYFSMDGLFSITISRIYDKL
jgi:hypothetical protein